MNKDTILVLDDDAGIITIVRKALERCGYDVLTTSSLAVFRRWAKAGSGRVAVVDVMVEHFNTLDYLQDIKQECPNLPIIVMSARNTLLTALQATEKGAFEYLPKPFDLEELISAVGRAISGRQSNIVFSQNAPKKEELPIVGSSPIMQNLYRSIAKIIKSDLNVFLTGESGVGKEMIAHILHQYSQRRDKPFIMWNASYFNILNLEYEIAYFTNPKNAESSYSSTFKTLLSGGTLFIDEVTDMSYDTQTLFLSLLQHFDTALKNSKKIQNNSKNSTRIIASSHRDIFSIIEKGSFRQDLYYRLNVVPLNIPSLRERLIDLPELVQHFCEKVAKEYNLPLRKFSADATNFMQNYNWYGNVRELENFIQRLLVLDTKTVIDLETVKMHLMPLMQNKTETQTTNIYKIIDDNINYIENMSDSFTHSIETHLKQYLKNLDAETFPGGLYQKILTDIERPLLSILLDITKGNQIKTADILGINRNTLRKKIQTLELDVVKRSYSK
jgi:two-component system nitrogen regulation response regulator GlnG